MHWILLINSLMVRNESIFKNKIFRVFNKTGYCTTGLSWFPGSSPTHLIYCKSSIKPLAMGTGLLISSSIYWWGGGVGLFKLEKMMVSVLHKDLRIQSGLAQVQEGWRSCSQGSESNPRAYWFLFPWKGELLSGSWGLFERGGGG